MLRHIQACNQGADQSLIPWFIQGQRVGWLKPEFAQLLVEQPIFISDQNGLSLDPQLDSFQARSQALEQLCQSLVQQGQMQPLMGELYPVTTGARQNALCLLDRAAAAYFGVIAYGQHVNGFVRQENEILMWIARRAADRFAFPNHLDNMVAGGLPWGIELEQNLIKEGQEEASIPPEFMAKARPCGMISYRRLTDKGLRPDILYCYDLELPPDFKPSNRDGEVADFYLMSLDQVSDLVRNTNEFKLNCNLVIIDFLIRWGHIQPDEEDYLALNLGLRSPIN